MKLDLPEFLRQHRKSESDFTRKRKLPFSQMILLGLTRSVESLQNRLNEAQRVLHGLSRGFAGGSVSASAYSQARAKLKHTAFMALNRDVLLPTYYAPPSEEGDITPRYWRGLRLVGIDGTGLALPNDPGLLAAFGGYSYKMPDLRKPGEHITGNRQGALAVVSYDLLNNLALDARLQGCRSNESIGALSMIADLSPNDLIITDRGFASYRYMAQCIQQGRRFLTRAQRSMYPNLQAEARRSPDKSAIGIIPMPYLNRAAMQDEGLPNTITLRCLLIDLPTGEEEVLFTSLLDSQQYPSEEFGWLYAQRWVEETYFDRLKNVMSLELFSGMSEESVRQDFWATLLVSNMETLFTADAQAILDAKPADNLYRQQVNHCVAFSTLRRDVMELMFSAEHSTDELLAQMTILFLQTPVPRRPNRRVPRTVPTPTQQIRFHKYTRKPAT